jgi:hypothetical protein
MPNPTPGLEDDELEGMISWQNPKGLGSLRSGGKQNMSPIMDRGRRRGGGWTSRTVCSIKRVRVTLSYPKSRS